MEKKAFHSFAVKANDQGVVEAIVAVMGNVDDGNDVIHPGAFTKTVIERTGKIRVLDAHRTDSTARLIAKPLEIRELSRTELPPELLTQYPAATGALWAKIQFLLDTPEGDGAFKRIKAGVLDEWSIGYDALDTDYSKAVRDGKEITIRNLRTCKLYEFSPVLWGMNSATSTLSAKCKKPDEAKPYRAIEEDGEWRVYKLDADGNPTGDPLGKHPTEEEAQAQVRALYANEGKPKKALSLGECLQQQQVEREANDTRWQIDYAQSQALESIVEDETLDDPGKVAAHRQLMLDYAAAMNTWFASALAAGVFAEENGSKPGMMMALSKELESKAGRVLAARNAQRIKDAIKILHEALADAGLMDVPEEDDPAPDGAADNQPKNGAGPEATPPPTQQDDLLRLIEIEEAKIRLLEV